MKRFFEPNKHYKLSIDKIISSHLREACTKQKSKIPLYSAQDTTAQFDFEAALPALIQSLGNELGVNVSEIKSDVNIINTMLESAGARAQIHILEAVVQAKACCEELKRFITNKLSASEIQQQNIQLITKEYATREGLKYSAKLIYQLSRGKDVHHSKDIKQIVAKFPMLKYSHSTRVAEVLDVEHIYTHYIEISDKQIPCFNELAEYLAKEYRPQQEATPPSSSSSSSFCAVM